MDFSWTKNQITTSYHSKLNSGSGERIQFSTTSYDIKIFDVANIKTVVGKTLDYQH